jgi:hypothetical protein
VFLRKIKLNRSTHLLINYLDKLLGSLCLKRTKIKRERKVKVEIKRLLREQRKEGRRIKRKRGKKERKGKRVRKRLGLGTFTRS